LFECVLQNADNDCSDDDDASDDDIDDTMVSRLFSYSRGSTYLLVVIFIVLIRMMQTVTSVRIINKPLFCWCILYYLVVKCIWNHGA